MAQRDEELEGLPVKIGRKTFIVPPMSIGAAKRTKADRALLGDATKSEEEKLDAGARVIHATLVRNYPDLTLEDIEDRLTLGNLPRVLTEIVRAWRFDSGENDAGKGSAGSLSTSTSSAAS